MCVACAVGIFRSVCRSATFATLYDLNPEFFFVVKFALPCIPSTQPAEHSLRAPNPSAKVACEVAAFRPPTAVAAPHAAVKQERHHAVTKAKSRRDAVTKRKRTTNTPSLRLSVSAGNRPMTEYEIDPLILLRSQPPHAAVKQEVHDAITKSKSWLA